MTITKDGKTILIVVVAAKHGFVFAFNRLTGEPVWPIEERAVPQSDVPGEHQRPDPAVPDLAEAVRAAELHRSRHQPARRRRKTRRRSAQVLREARATKACSRRRVRAARSRCRGTTAAPAGAARRSIPCHQRLFVVSQEIPR